MATDFIGYTILVTLQYPPGARLQGVVANVVNQKLLLNNVLLWTGERFPSYTIESSAIADLEVSPAQSHPIDEDDLKTPTASRPLHPLPNAVLRPPQTQSAAFLDPAILSYTKPIANKQVQSGGSRIPMSPVMIANGAVSNKATAANIQSSLGQPGIAKVLPSNPIPAPSKRSSSATATLTEPFDSLRLEAGIPPVDGKEKGRASQTRPGIIDMNDVNHAPLKPAKRAGKGKGWRQTPLIEEIPKSASQKKQRGRRGVGEDANGWATEDATDIQDMGDFDFESNLSKFDKRRVFDEIRREDTTADSDRLVSFNRKARPGTNGGRNLHWTENVLDPADAKDKWKSEAGETEDELQEEPYSSGRGSRRATSKKPAPARKSSAFPGFLDRTESPRPITRKATASPMNGSISGIRGAFRMSNNKPCTSISPLQMLELEQLCISEIGLTEDMLTENAGRSIADAIFKIPDVKTVAFLVGNHKSGARAIAAARHLRNRRLRITVILLGGEREDMSLLEVRKQLAVYRNGQGYLDRWDEYQSKLASGLPQPDLVVDALFGVHVAFDELRTEDQTTAFEMIKWANRAAAVMSIDVPSGLSASSGLPTETDGQNLVVVPKHVLALGAPKNGLLHAMALDSIENRWSVSVADIGISTAAWQKHGTRRKHGIDFGAEWVVPLKFVASTL